MTATTAETIAAWPELDQFDLDMLKVAAAAEGAGTALAQTGGHAVVDLSPGNGHRYLMVLVHFTEEEGFYLPGDLLLALPEFHTSTLLASTGYHVPSYVNEKLELGLQHSAVVAAFATLLGDVLRRP